MSNKYLEKVAAIMGPPGGPKAKTMGSVVRSAASMSSGKFGFHSMAKTPMIKRIKDSFH